MELFKPLVSSRELHPNFVNTLRAPSASVRKVLLEWAKGFPDRDGKFIKEFQTTYNSSFWELYLFAVLKEIGIKIDFEFNAPDFVAADEPLAIEATIASHARDDTPEWEKRFEDIVDMDVFDAQAKAAIRASNAFWAKSNAYLERYSKLPHMAGRSYVIAISNYGTPDFNLLGDIPMQHVLYDNFDLGHLTKENGARVSLGLFKTGEFAHVSAVLYSSVATFGKARALCVDANEFVFEAYRIRNNIEPILIRAHKKDYEESLTDGLRLFTNPYATTPINVNLFDDWGVRTFEANKNGDFLVSCHPDGDLCARQTYQMVGPGKAVTPNMIEMPAYVTHAKTARIAAGLSQNALAAMVSERCDRGFEFDKALVKHIEACKPLSFIEIENYVSALLSLPQTSCVPDIVFSLRKRPRPPARGFR
ncbi:hypothetical protein LPW26_04410 [Rhodopseudomonas sp. HC1]|uniref:hypothetical protein n=1 Tax=Rhodopseudomonas infernalis TaxID=2897386 RepID=UPI001EE7BF43|nr:hypothetical protein [Rhodopseudomonas infernalis]MCG6203871.1 hypothetical protein [Rhodopseudomonas infernalis]